MSFPEQVSGYCPECDCEMEIVVNFTEMRVIGMKNSEYRAMSYLCEHKNENGCTITKSDDKQCPLFKPTSY